MGYRPLPQPKKKPNRTMQDTTTPSRLYVQNGATADFAIPCWYSEIRPPIRTWHHSRSEHDHWGWPSPTRPDQSCQWWDFAHHGCGQGHLPTPPFGHASAGCGQHRVCGDFLDLSRTSPIHLTEEGYTDVEIAFHEKPEGLTAIGVIDDRHDWIVRLFFDAKEDTAITEPVSCRWTARVLRNDGRRDTVGTGIITIVPAALVVSEGETDE